MFNRKKKKIAELTQLAAMWKDQVSVGNEEINRLHGEIEELQEKLAHEQDHVSALMQANGELKRELYEQEQKCEKLKSDLTGAAALLEETQKKLTGDTDLQALKDKVLVEVARDLACPSDCTKHANPGPGGSVCRNCIRNPRAVDKYTNGTYTPENGKE